MYENYSGVVLAGGAGKRFGGLAKSKIEIDGESIISRIIGTISDLFSEVIIVTNTPRDYSEFSVKLTSDHYANIGPLGGIHAAMRAASAGNLFVFGADMPLIRKEAIIQQVEFFENSSYDILVARKGDLIEPLHAIYRKALLPLLENYIVANENRSLWKFFRTVNSGHIDFGSMPDAHDIFFNVNSPSDIKLLKNILDERKLR